MTWAPWIMTANVARSLLALASVAHGNCEQRRVDAPELRDRACGALVCVRVALPHFVHAGEAFGLRQLERARIGAGELLEALTRFSRARRAGAEHKEQWKEEQTSGHVDVDRPELPLS